MNTITNNPRAMRTYRTLRKSYSASVAVAIIRGTTHPDEYDNDALVFERTVKGVHVRVVAEINENLDTDLSWPGHFSDNWAPDAVQNDQWRPSNRSVCRWFHPETGTVAEAAKFYRAREGRHAAWLRATRQVQEDMAIARGDMTAGVDVDVSVYVANDGARGRLLATRSHASDVLWAEPVEEQVCRDILPELIDEALDDAADEIDEQGRVSGEVLRVLFDAGANTYVASARRDAGREWGPEVSGGDLGSLLDAVRSDMALTN